MTTIDTATLDQYLAECKTLFGADRYGWSIWEADRAEEAYFAGRDAQDAVYDMNDAYARRRGDRNA